MSARSQALFGTHGFLAGTQHGVYSAARWERPPVLRAPRSPLARSLGAGNSGPLLDMALYKAVACVAR